MLGQIKVGFPTFGSFVITSYSIHYTKLYEAQIQREQKNQAQQQKAQERKQSVQPKTETEQAPKETAPAEQPSYNFV